MARAGTECPTQSRSPRDRARVQPHLEPKPCEESSRKFATLAFQSDIARKVLPKSNEFIPLFIPKRDNDRPDSALERSQRRAKRLTEEVLPPLVELARSNSRQSAAIGNMKQLGLAMHNYHDTHKAFPPAASLAKDGKQKLFSWRVLILPFLDPALYVSVPSR